MTPPDIRRDLAMDSRVGRTLEDAGLAPADIALVRAAHRLAMERRIERLDAHHPDFLHPGRTVLILVLDTGFRDAEGLAAAALIDSERPDLRADPTEILDRLGLGVAEWLEAVPVEEEGLVEALVIAPEAVRRVALAERLDHCRHAKFWTDAAAKARILDQAEGILGPLAERTDATLARRFAHWSGAFARTLAKGG